MTPDDHEKTQAFVKLVERMRRLQKEYFKGRSHDTLMQSKQAEQDVDNAIAEINDKQRKLFDDTTCDS